MFIVCQYLKREFVPEFYFSRVLFYRPHVLYFTMSLPTPNAAARDTSWDAENQKGFRTHRDEMTDRYFQKSQSHRTGPDFRRRFLNLQVPNKKSEWEKTYLSCQIYRVILTVSSCLDDSSHKPSLVYFKSVILTCVMYWFNLMFRQ